MNVHHLFADTGDRPVRYALSGAGGGFARTLLAQTRHLARLHPVALCDVDVARLREVCRELGYAEDELAVCPDAAAVTEATRAGRIALIADAGLLGAAEWDILVEATGSPAHGYAMARKRCCPGGTSPWSARRSTPSPGSTSPNWPRSGASCTPPPTAISPPT